jgi:outer membrane protein OmpA-like peptidoglycan-associated protein
MRTIRTTLAIALATLSATSAAAQNDDRGFAGGDQDNGIHSNTILGMPVSPRAVGVAEAMGTIDRDPGVIWYNAAGLVGLRNNAFTINGAQRFGLTQLVGAAAAFPTEIAAFGVGVRAFNAGTVEEFRFGEQVGGNVRAYQWVLEGGGALQLARWWRWGGTLYFSQETLADETAGSVGINSGMQFPEVFGRLSLAAGFRNWGTNVNFDEDGESFSPPLFGYAGAGFDLFRQRNLLQTPMLFRGQPIILDAKLLGQAFVPDRNEPYFGFGVESTVNGVVIGRIGWQTGDDNRRGLSLGAGVNVGQFRLEYAFRDQQNGGAKFFSNDPAGDSHNVSFSYFWGEKERNEPVVPVILTQPIDTAALNAAIREALDRQLAQLRPLLDSLRSRQVEISQSDLVAKYVVPVHFDFDSAVVRDSDMVVLGQIADVIKRVYPNAIVTIEGFADPAGTVAYNQRLSLRRAEAVRDVMVSRFGLPARQFKVVGYGEQEIRQVEPGARRDDPGAQSNRRVTFTIDATQRF